MITDLYDLEECSDRISEELIRQIKYLAEAKSFGRYEKIEIKFKINRISSFL